MTQLPDPDLVRDIGIASWLLIVITLSGVTTIGFFLRRITQAMDRMAAAQEATPALVGELRTLFIERMDRIEQKVTRAADLAEEHVRIGRMWEKTEAPGRHVREDKSRPG